MTTLCSLDNAQRTLVTLCAGDFAFGEGEGPALVAGDIDELRAFFGLLGEV